MPFSAEADSRSDLDASNASNRVGNSSQNGVGAGESSLPPFVDRNHRVGANAAEKAPCDLGDAKGRRKTFHGARAQDRRKNTPSLDINQAESRANTISLLSPDLPVNPLPNLDSHVLASSVLAPPHTFSFFGTSRNDAFAFPSKRGEYVDSDDTLCNDVNAHSLSGIEDKQVGQDSLYKSRDNTVVSPIFRSKSTGAKGPNVPRNANGELERASKRRKLKDYADPTKETTLDVRRSLTGNSSNPINVETMIESEIMDGVTESFYTMEPKMEFVSPRLGLAAPGGANALSGPTDEHGIIGMAPAIEQYISQHVEQWENRKAHWTSCDFDSWMAGGNVIVERFARLFENVQASVDSDLKAFQEVDAILQDHKLNTLDRRDEMLRQVKDTIVAGSSDILSTCSTNTLTAAPVDIVRK